MLKGLIPFLRASYTKILVGGIVLLFGVVFYQHYTSLKKDNKIQQLIFDVSYLENENQSLAMTIYTLNNLRDAENAELERVRARADQLKQQTDKYLREVEDAYEEGNDRRLPDDVVRVLRDACKAVSGNSCNDP